MESKKLLLAFIGLDQFLIFRFQISQGILVVP